jgi:UDP-N-acetylmuramoyl-tripeptide--D-alanyl-D-alanine ligase
LGTPIGANLARLDALGAAEATGGHARIAGALPRVARGVTTDSRAVVPGCAFLALRGEKHDGHAYFAAAIDAGAVLLVSERGRAPADDRVDTVEVDDTLSALGLLAKAHLRQWKQVRPDARVVGITGSAGKTTTKELCAALLGATAGCLATRGNLNNRIGLPSVAFQVEPPHRFAVLEMGMSLRGEIAALCDVAEPDVAIVTNVGFAHAEGVGGTMADVAREKGAIFAALREGGVAIVNADDPHVVEQASRVAPGVTCTSFGRAPSAAVRLVEREPLGASGSRVQVARLGHLESFTLPIPGEAAAIDFVAALAAAEAALGHALATAQIEGALASLAPISGRMQVRRLREGIVVLDDAYNANPASARAAVGTLREIAEVGRAPAAGDGPQREAAGRRLAVLGEMRELGEVAEREHESLGEFVAESGVDLLISCGGLADATARAAGRRGVTVLFADGADEAARVAVDRVLPGDFVLVKASRSIGAERVVSALARAHGEEPA